MFDRSNDNIGMLIIVVLIIIIFVIIIVVPTYKWSNRNIFCVTTLIWILWIIIIILLIGPFWGIVHMKYRSCEKSQIE